MTMTDRTQEFRGAVNVFRPTVTVVKNSSEAAESRAQSDLGYRKTSEFLQLASSVAVGFEGTSKLIGRLKKLVGRKGFSNNPAAEINEVMKLFEEDMAGLQRDISSLQRHADGKTRGSPPLNSQRQMHCAFIVTTLRKSAQEHTKAFRDALLLRAAVEKQQNERQRKFSHSRGVAPATQLDYPLFGNGTSGPRRRGRPSAPLPRPPAPAAAPLDVDDEDNKGHKPSGRAAGVGLAASTAAAAVVSSMPFPSGKPGGGVGSSGGGVAAGSGGSGGSGGGRGGQGGSSWPQKPGPPPWPPGGYGIGAGGGGTGYGNGAAGAPPVGGGALGAAGSGFGRGAGGTSAPAHSNGSGFRGHGQGLGYGHGGAPPGAPLRPPEPPRASSGATGLRKRSGREDGVDGEEEARRAAWQVQVQEDSKARVDESHKVEKMIGELGQMFSRFSTMVAAQEEVVMHIEDDVEAAHAFAEEGQAHLAKYYQIMSGNRGIIIKVFIMLILFIWVFLGLMR
eukprot:g9193.t1